MDMHVAMRVYFGYAAAAGAIGAVVMAMLIPLVKLGGYRLDFPFILGSRVVGISNNTTTYSVGLLLHLLMGAAWGILYAILLAGMNFTPNWPAGLLWGFAHGVFTGVLLSTTTRNNPHIGDGKTLPDPGMMGRRWSPAMPYWILVLHMIFGGITLFLYYRWAFMG
jgi:hypothetical protein